MVAHARTGSLFTFPREPLREIRLYVMYEPGIRDVIDFIHDFETTIMFLDVALNGEGTRV
jgi:hypothetical protein